MFIVYCLELYECKFISNVKRFCHGFYGFTQVDNISLFKINKYINFFFSVLFLRRTLTWKHWLGIVTVVAGLSVVGISDVLFSKESEGSHSNSEKLAGDALILIAMLFTSFQVNIFC